MAKPLKACWLAEEKAGFAGWDFSHLDGRWDSEALPWNYKQIVEAHLRPDMRLLDMGTGGGEFLLSLKHPYDKTTVTEAWAPNLKLCRERLAPLGIQVAQVFNDDDLPFEDDSFDIVLNRHEAFDLGEVKRVLKPGGLFITQQVGGQNNGELALKLLPCRSTPFPDLDLAHVSRQLTQAGFEIMDGLEHFPLLRFYDIGAVVYFAKIIEWEFPGFTVKGCLDNLTDLQEEIAQKGFVESREHRFLIVAHSPKG